MKGQIYYLNYDKTKIFKNGKKIIPIVFAFISISFYVVFFTVPHI